MFPQVLFQLILFFIFLCIQTKLSEQSIVIVIAVAVIVIIIIVIVIFLHLPYPYIG